MVELFDFLFEVFDFLFGVFFDDRDDVVVGICLGVIGSVLTLGL